jgi:uncharacterized membrane protein
MMDQTAQALEKAATTIEHAEFLDPVADVGAGLAAKAFPDGPVHDAASGKFLGHPLHPLLVTMPIGSWLSASVLDFTGGNAKAAQRLTLFGVLAAAPTALTGANDWSRTTGARRRVGLVHAVANHVALTAYTASWIARRRGHRAKGALFALVGASALGAGGWLGGHLSYRMGVGVDAHATSP